MRHHRSAIKCNNSTKCPSYISSHWVHIPMGQLINKYLANKEPKWDIKNVDIGSILKYQKIHLQVGAKQTNKQRRNKTRHPHKDNLDIISWGLVVTGLSPFWLVLSALFPQVRRIFVHFSLQIAPWQLFTFHSKYPPILRRNPHRRVQLRVIYLTPTVKHEVSKSISPELLLVEKFNSMPCPPFLTTPPPPSGFQFNIMGCKDKEWKLWNTMATHIWFNDNGNPRVMCIFIFLLSFWYQSEICKLDAFINTPAKEPWKTKVAIWGLTLPKMSPVNDSVTKKGWMSIWCLQVICFDTQLLHLNHDGRGKHCNKDWQGEDEGRWKKVGGSTVWVHQVHLVLVAVVVEVLMIVVGVVIRYFYSSSDYNSTNNISRIII